MKKHEVRTFNLSGVETRAEGDNGKHTLVGYASVFDSPTMIYDDLEETIASGAFSKELSNHADVRCLFNHDWANVLGRTKSNTLKLEEDEKGLRFEVTLPDTTVARDLVSSIDRGDIDQCSFGFIPTKEQWDFDSNPVKRMILEVNLFEVSIVALPAYQDTEVSLARSANVSKENVEQRKKILKIIEGAKTNE